MVPRLVHKIEGGYPERDIGAGQGWGDSRRLIHSSRSCEVLKVTAIKVSDWEADKS